MVLHHHEKKKDIKGIYEQLIQTDVKKSMHILMVALKILTQSFVHHN